MKRRRKPFDKEDLLINKNERVLEVGPGSNPTRRADVLLEKYVDNDDHRRGEFRIFAHQSLVEGDAEEMPFQDKEFDYTICSHVLEHANDPSAFLNELARVSKRGYIETPSLIGEFLAPKQSHKWVLFEINDTLVLLEKKRLGWDIENDFGNLFLNYLPYNSLYYKLLHMTTNNFIVVRYEWTDRIKFVVNPENYYRDFFVNKPDPDIVRRIFPRVPVLKQIQLFLSAIFHFTKKRYFQQKNKTLSLDEYKRIKLR